MAHLFRHVCVKIYTSLKCLNIAYFLLIKQFSITLSHVSLWRWSNINTLKQSCKSWFLKCFWGENFKVEDCMHFHVYVLKLTRDMFRIERCLTTYKITFLPLGLSNKSSKDTSIQKDYIKKLRSCSQIFPCINTNYQTFL